MEIAGESAVPEASEVLTATEVTNIVEGTPPEEAVLPSDAIEFEIPDKFKGKSVEDVIKSYQELEKFKGGGQESTEGEVPLETEEVGEKVEPTVVEQEQYNKYAESYDANGGLSEAEYAELAKAGYTKEVVDNEIKARTDRQEFDKYKQEKTLTDILEPLGGGQDKFKEVAQWANSNKPEADIKAFNEALASSGKIAQQAMLRGLYAEYEATGTAVESGPLHTNQTQTQPNKGYKTQEEFFKDVGSEEYQNNSAYRKAVEDKMSKSSIF